MSTPSGSSEVSAAPISEPTSMVPVVSIVTWTMIGVSVPAALRARRAPTIAAFACSKSWQVSITIASTPPSMSPRAHCS